MPQEMLPRETAGTGAASAGRLSLRDCSAPRPFLPRRPRRNPSARSRAPRPARRRNRTSGTRARCGPQSDPSRFARWWAWHVKRIAGFARLEKYVGILRAAPQLRAVRREGALAMPANGIFVEHGAQVFVGKRENLVHFVGRPESVEKMQKRDSALRGSRRGRSGRNRSLPARSRSTAWQIRSRAPPSRRCDRRRSRARAWQSFARPRESPRASILRRSCT